MDHPPGTTHPSVATGAREPSTLKHQHTVIRPQPSILDPRPSTLNPQPPTLSPQPSTLNLPPSSCEPSTFDSGCEQPPSNPPAFASKLTASFQEPQSDFHNSAPSFPRAGAESSSTLVGLARQGQGAQKTVRDSSLLTTYWSESTTSSRCHSRPACAMGL